MSMLNVLVGQQECVGILKKYIYRTDIIVDKNPTKLSMPIRSVETRQD